MAPSVPFGVTRSVKAFEIRVDEDHLLLRGPPEEAASVRLTGTLFLSLSDSIKINSVSLHFAGRKWRHQFNMSDRDRFNYPLSMEIFRHEWMFLRSEKYRPLTLEAGEHKWPFELVLKGDMRENIEVLQLHRIGKNFLHHEMKATIDRGPLANRIEARKHIRLIRTIEPSSLELLQGASLDKEWPGKASYKVITQTRAAVLGSHVDVDYVVVPIVKGLTIDKVVTEVRENQLCHYDDLPWRKSYDSHRIVAKDEFIVPAEMETQDVDGLEGYRFTRRIHLPRNLKDCLQDVDQKLVNVNHEIKISIQLVNPRVEYISEIRGALPLIIYISPNLRFNEQNELINPPDSVDEMAEGGDNQGPPGYSHHRLDEPWDDADKRAWSSVPVTPTDGPSRSQSSNDLDSLLRDPGHPVSPRTLEKRLGNLNLAGPSPGGDAKKLRASKSGSSTPSASVLGWLRLFGGRPANPARRHTRSRSLGLPSDTHNPRVPSGVHTAVPSPTHPAARSGAQTPTQADYDAEALTRTPSYNTAVRTPVHRDFAPGLPILPDYEAAVGGRPSPATRDSEGDAQQEPEVEDEEEGEQGGDAGRPAPGS